jgi:hypothetical protein
MKESEGGEGRGDGVFQRAKDEESVLTLTDHLSPQTPAVSSKKKKKKKKKGASGLDAGDVSGLFYDGDL